MTPTTRTEPTSEDSVKEHVAKLPFPQLAKETFVGCKDDQVLTSAAAIAYHTVFAIPPAIVCLVTLAALLEHGTSISVSERLLHAIETGAPGGSRELLTNLVDDSIANMSGGTAWFGFVIAALVALWSGSNAVSTAIGACNRAYDVDEDRPIIRQKLIAIALTLLMAVLSTLAFLLFVFGHVLGSWIARWAGLGGAFETTWNISRWPAGVLLIIFLLAVMYHLCPNIEQSIRWLSSGSIVATLLWIATVLGFKLYLAVSNPGSAYGAIGSVGLLLFFLFASAIAFLVGAEVNAILGRRYDPATVKDLATHPGKLEGGEARQDAQQRARTFEQREEAGAGTGAVGRHHSTARSAVAWRALVAAGSRALALVRSLVQRRQTRA